MRLWVDTDVGTNPDDAIALLLAAAHPTVDLVGVSTVGADAAWRAAVAREVLRNAPDVPVVAGAAAAVEAVPAGAADALLAIGPLTNVAALGVAGWRPPRLVVMGGALRPVRHRGVVRTTESNFAADPAGAMVALAEPGATVVPLDATVATRLDPAAQGALLAAVPALLPAVEAWLAVQADAGVPAGERAVHLHDPSALLVAVGEPLARLEPRRLVVEEDGRLRTAPGGVSHDVVTKLDGDAVVARVLGLLGAQFPGGDQPTKAK